jgi:hypothetical protein
VEYFRTPIDATIYLDDNINKEPINLFRNYLDLSVIKRNSAPSLKKIVSASNTPSSKRMTEFETSILKGYQYELSGNRKSSKERDVSEDSSSYKIKGMPIQEVVENTNIVNGKWVSTIPIITPKRMKVRHKTFEKIRTNSLPPIINLEKGVMSNNFYRPSGGINKDLDTYFQVN